MVFNVLFTVVLPGRFTPVVALPGLRHFVLSDVELVVLRFEIRVGDPRHLVVTSCDCYSRLNTS